MKNKIFIAVLIMIVARSLFGQSIMLSSDGLSIVLSSRSVPQEAVVQPVEPVAQPEPVVEAVQPEPVKAVPAVRKWYLVSESWCRHCPAAKQRFLRKGWSEKNVITIAEAKRRFDITVSSVPHEFEAIVDVVQPAVLKRRPPVRYIQWNGWGTIDLETYNRNCNCGMCQSIRSKQQEYQRQLREYQQTSLPADQQPCPHDTVNSMLDLMSLTKEDTLADLGCGDGRILIAAARRGVRGIGIEIDPARADEARAAVKTAGFSHMVSIETGDAKKFDASRVTAITAYLYPTLLAELSTKLKSVRVVGSPFHKIPGLAMVQSGDVWVYLK